MLLVALCVYPKWQCIVNTNTNLHHFPILYVCSYSEELTRSIKRSRSILITSGLEDFLFRISLFFCRVSKYHKNCVIVSYKLFCIVQEIVKVVKDVLRVCFFFY